MTNLTNQSPTNEPKESRGCDRRGQSRRVVQCITINQSPSGGTRITSTYSVSKVHRIIFHPWWTLEDLVEEVLATATQWAGSKHITSCRAHLLHGLSSTRDDRVRCNKPYLNAYSGIRAHHAPNEALEFFTQGLEPVINLREVLLSKSMPCLTPTRVRQHNERHMTRRNTYCPGTTIFVAVSRIVIPRLKTSAALP